MTSRTPPRTRYFMYTCGRCETVEIVEPHPVEEPIRCPICRRHYILNKEIDEEYAMEYPELIRHIE